ncbi:MAG: putative oxidoreductase [Geminicoccaceae bacterium]|jgi:NAD(P)-dependent dehydrogenase (short-subunit alcohol dehydrogenase family)|nr:putative oxidoreductase [Geminicoccaceae bacterium]
MSSPLPLEGKVAVLTGVSRRGQVGAVVARTLAESGATVVLIDRTGLEAEQRAQELRTDRLNAIARSADLTDPAQLDRVVRVVADQFDGVDALVNIAGGFSMSGKVADSDPEAWARQLGIGLTTAYLTTRAFLPLVRRRRGSIVFFASAAALPGGRIGGMSAYAVSKAGVIALMRAVAQEERETGVRANALAPTSIRTATNIESMGPDARYVEREEVADAVRFLCFSPASRAISGQVIQLG